MKVSEEEIVFDFQESKKGNDKDTNYDYFGGWTCSFEECLIDRAEMDSFLKNVSGNTSSMFSETTVMLSEMGLSSPFSFFRTTSFNDGESKASSFSSESEESIHSEEQTDSLAFARKFKETPLNGMDEQQRFVRPAQGEGKEKTEYGVVEQAEFITINVTPRNTRKSRRNKVSSFIKKRRKHASSLRSGQKVKFEEKAHSDNEPSSQSSSLPNIPEKQARDELDEILNSLETEEQEETKTGEIKQRIIKNGYSENKEEEKEGERLDLVHYYHYQHDNSVFVPSSLEELKEDTFDFSSFEFGSPTKDFGLALPLLDHSVRSPYTKQEENMKVDQGNFPSGANYLAYRSVV